MKWLQNNLPGVILLGACGAVLLMSAWLALAWSGPPRNEIDAVADPALAAPDGVGQLADLGPIGDYRIVTDRPLFNETRRPVIEVEEIGEAEPVEEESAVADAPSVALTGVVITPDAKLVSLTREGGGEPLVFREGMPMRGEFNGWLVSEVGPRRALLESTDGKTLELTLAVYDDTIKAPPKPAPAPRTTAAAANVAPDAAAQEDAELARMEEDLGEERLSRAEEIRQRIAERREQLRQEAEAKQQSGAREGGGAQSNGAGGRQQLSPYQQAIRNLMNEQSKDKKADDDDEDP